MGLNGTRFLCLIKRFISKFSKTSYCLKQLDSKIFHVRQRHRQMEKSAFVGDYFWICINIVILVSIFSKSI